jgi:hypothetical protein
MASKRFRLDRARNACTVCYNECEKSQGLPCSNCTESTHSFCVGMSLEDVVVFQRSRGKKFVCPNCVSTNKGCFDCRKCLDRYASQCFLIKMILKVLRLQLRHFLNNLSHIKIKYKRHTNDFTIRDGPLEFS